MRRSGIRWQVMPLALALIGAPGVMAQTTQQDQQQQQPRQQQQQQQPRHEVEPPVGQRTGQQQQDQQRQQQLRLQNQQQQAMQQGQQQQAMQAALIRGSELLNKQVRNPQGENLGQIEEVVADVSNGRIAYAVLSFGGMMGIGDELYAIPWEALQQVDDQADFVVLNVQRQQLEQAQGFDRDNWPNMGDPQFLNRTYQHYGVEPYEATRPGQRQMERIDPQGQPQGQINPQQEHGMQRSPAAQPGQQQQAQQPGQAQQQPQAANQQQQQQQQQQQAAQEVQLDRRQFWVNRASDLIGLDVIDQQDEDLGVLRDIVIDTREGRLVYGVVGFGGLLGIGESYAAVPWNSLDIRPAREAFVLQADRQTLEGLAFDPDQWPDLNDQQWALRVHQAFDTEPYWQVFGYPAPGQAQQQQQQQPGQLQQRQQFDQQQFQRSGWSPQSQYNQQYDADQVTRIQGTIVRTGNFQPQAGDPEGVQLTIRDQQGQTHTVHVAPRGYLERQQVQLRENQQIQIEGSQAQIQGDEVVLARQIQINGQTIELRNQQGQPLWQHTDLQQQSQQQTQPGQQQQQQDQQQQQLNQQRQQQLNQQRLEQQRLEQQRQQLEQQRQQMDQQRQQQSQPGQTGQQGQQQSPSGQPGY